MTVDAVVAVDQEEQELLSSYTSSSDFVEIRKLMMNRL